MLNRLADEDIIKIIDRAVEHITPPVPENGEASAVSLVFRLSLSHRPTVCLLASSLITVISVPALNSSCDLRNRVAFIR